MGTRRTRPTGFARGPACAGPSGSWVAPEPDSEFAGSIKCADEPECCCEVSGQGIHIDPGWFHRRQWEALLPGGVEQKTLKLVDAMTSSTGVPSLEAAR